MKKSLIALTLLAAATSALAGGLRMTGGYDYLRPNKGQPDALRYQQSAFVGVAYGTTLGIFDAKAIGVQTVAGVKDHAAGYELGYSNGFKTSTGGLLTGRVAYGKLNLVDLKTGVMRENQRYYSLGGELAAPISHRTGAFIAYEHKQGMTTGTPISNKWTVGADLKATNNVGLRVSYAYANLDTLKENGFGVAVNYDF